MTKRIEYCVTPVDRWIVSRFEHEESEGRASGGCTQRGYFQNEDAANEVAVLLAKAEGATIRRSARKSLIKLANNSGIAVEEF
jgi:hypothetical protein